MKTLILYAFHSLNANLLFFIKHGLINDPNLTFVFIGNCSRIDVPDLSNYTNSKLFFRDNVGYDFGAWSHGLFKLPEIKRDDYDYFIFINQTVKGPFLPVYYKNHWTKIFIEMLDDKTKLVGTTVGFYEDIVHLQSMLLVTDKIGLSVGIDNGIFTPNIKAMTHDETILNKEIGFSQTILKNGYNLNCSMQLFHDSDFRTLSSVKMWNQRNFDMNFDLNYFGLSIDPNEVVFIKANRDIDPYKLEFYSQVKNKTASNLICRDYAKWFQDNKNKTKIDHDYLRSKYYKGVKWTNKQLEDHYTNSGVYDGRVPSIKEVNSAKVQLVKKYLI